MRGPLQCERLACLRATTAISLSSIQNQHQRLPASSKICIVRQVDSVGGGEEVLFAMSRTASVASTIVRPANMPVRGSGDAAPATSAAAPSRPAAVGCRRRASSSSPPDAARPPTRRPGIGHTEWPENALGKASRRLLPSMRAQQEAQHVGGMAEIDQVNTVSKETTYEGLETPSRNTTPKSPSAKAWWRKSSVPAARRGRV